MSRYQDALKEYEERMKKEEEEKKQSAFDAKREKINAAVREYENRQKSNAQNAMSSLAERINAELETAKTASTPSWGADSLRNALDATRDSRVNIGKLQRELESYKGYIGETEYKGLSDALKSLQDGYSNHLGNAEKQEVAYSEYCKQGWDAYQTDKKLFLDALEKRNQAIEDARKNESFWEKLGRWLGESQDTSMPLGSMPSIIQDMAKTTAEAAQLQSLFSFDTDNYTDEQKKEFGRLYKEDIKTAAEYAKAIELGKAEEFATDNIGTGALHTAGSILASPITGMADFLYDLAQGAARGEIITETPSLFEYSQAGTQAITKDLNEIGTLYEGIPVIGGKGLGDVYGIGTSIAQSALAAVTGGGLQATATFFGSAAASGVDDALSRGATTDQAIYFGFASGFAEAAAEYLPTEMLLGNAGKSFFKAVGKQMLAEGFEEGATSIFTNIADDIINGENSQFNHLVLAYMEGGMSREDAVKKAWVQTFEDVAFDSLAGALSGGISGAGFSTISNYINDTQVGKNIINEAEAAENFDTVSALKSLAYEMAGEKKTSADKQLAKTAGKINYMNLNARQVGKTTRLLNESVTSQNKADIQAALVDSGISKKIAESLAGYIAEGNIAEYADKVAKLDLADRVRVEDAIDNIVSDPLSSVNVREQRLESAKQGEYSREAAPKTSEQVTSEVMKGDHKVSESGNTVYVNENGETEDVSIQKIVSTDGGIKVELDNGKTVNAKDLELSSDADAMAFEMITRMETTPETAQVIFEAVKASDATSSEALFIDVPTAYKYGKINYEAGLAKLRIPDAIKKLAFDRGRSDATPTATEAEQTAQEATDAKETTSQKKGKVVFEGFEYSDAKATDMQKASMAGIKLLTKMSSLEIHVYASWVEDGKRYAMVNGKKRVAPNGWHEEGTNKIYVDINAGTYGEGAMLYTLAHEVTHYIANWNWAGFKRIGDFLIENFGKNDVPVDVLIARKKKTLIKSYERDGKEVPGETQLYKEAYEEVVAEAMTTMFTDPKAYDKLAEYKKQDKKGWQKLGEAIKKLLDKLKSLLGVYSKTKSSAVEADFVAQFSKDVYDKLQDLYLNAFVEADANYQAAQRDGTANKHLNNRSISYNERAIESHKVKLEEQYSKDASIDLDTLMKRYEKIISIWKSLGGELDSKFLNEWNNKVGKDRAFTVFKAQSGYKYNVELSSMCKKGVPLFEAIDTIVKKEVMKELGTDVLGKTEKEILYDILKSHSFEIPCAICYVEQARQREGAIIDSFLNGKIEKDSKGKTKTFKLGWNEVLKDVEKEMKALGVDYTFQAVDRAIATDKYVPADISMDATTQEAFYNALKKVANKEITRYNKEEGKSRKLVNAVTPAAIKEALKGTLPSNLKIFKVLFTDPSARFTLESDLLYSSMTTHNLATAHNALYSLFNSQGGVSGYKTKQGTVVYWGDILGKKWTPSTVRDEGGIRNQSNSDFQMYTLLDQAQMYIDFSAKGYYLQAYTKVLSELKLFGLSRGKINASLIPAVYEYRNADGTIDIEATKENAGLDKNGDLMFDDIEGINHKEAFMLLEDAEYSKSIGGICIGYSDNHIFKLLDDQRVQQIIGFHDKTDDPDKRYRGARYAKNYNGLNEAIDKDGGTVHIGFNPYVRKAEKMFTFDAKTETYSGEIEYNGKTYVADDIPKLAADLYLEMCEKKGYTPAYTDFDFHENYYKLLADFSLYDNQGHYAPHRKVAYNMPDQVPYLDINGKKQYMPTKDYIKAELEKELSVRDAISEALADESENGIIPQFKKRVNEAHNSYSERDTDIRYNEREYFVEDKYFKSQMAKWGNLKHGTFVHVGKVGEKHPLHLVGMPTGTLRYDVSKLQKNMADHDDYLTVELLNAIPEIIAHPVAISEYSEENTVSVFGDVFVGNSPMMVGVTIAKDRAGNDITKVRTYNARKDVGNLITDDTVLYLDENKKRTQKWFHACGIQVPLGETKFGFIRSIAQKKDSVKRKFSERTSYAPTFYSYMGKIVDDIRLDKMGANGVVPYLKGKGVKDEEIKWSGIETFLEGKKSVTKAELQEFVAGSQLAIEEKLGTGGARITLKPSDYGIDSWDIMRGSEVLDTYSWNEDSELYESDITGGGFSTKDRVLEYFKEKYGSGDTRWAQYKLDGGENYRELVFKMPNSTYSNQMMRTHWGENAEGILVHARIQDFEVDGKKMLFIEEIQSDWHNQGAKRGYADSRVEKRAKLYSEIGEALHDFDDPSHMQRAMALREELRKLDAELAADGVTPHSAPDAPFRSTYHEYVLKRLLRMAAEEGYDSIGWTPSEIQSQRWSDEYAEAYRIEYDQEMPKFLRKYGKKWGATVGKTMLGQGWAKANESYIASQKEYIAGWQESLAKAESDSEADFIRDQIKYHEEEIKGAEIDGEIVWSMDITDSMKDSVLNEGQVMYQERDYSDGLSEADKETAKKVISGLKIHAGTAKYGIRSLGAYTDVRMDREIREASSPTVLDYAKSYITWVEPIDFIYATTHSEQVRDVLREEAGELDIERLRKETQPIHLTVNFETGEIVGHEGRHRMLALQKAGVDRVAVVIDALNDDRHHTKPIEFKQLKGQNFGQYSRGDGFFLHDVLPLSKRYADVAKELFSIEPKGGIRFQERDPDSISNRSLLANALESAAKEGEERNILRNYKTNLRLLEAEQAKLADVREKAHDLRFKKGRTAEETKALNGLDFEAKQIAKRINTYDRELLKIEAMKPIKDVLNREKQMAYKRGEQKGKEALKKQRERESATYKKLLAEHQESRKKAIEGRHKTEMRHKIKKVVGDLNNLLLNPTKDKHVPIGLQLVVADALDAINMDTMNAAERVAYYNDRIAKSNNPDEIEMLTKKRDFFEYRDMSFKDKVTALKNAYAEFKNSDDPLIRNAHNDAIADLIENTSDLVGKKSLKDMSYEQLDAVYNMYKAILATVRNANKMFKEGRQETITEASQKAAMEVMQVGGSHSRELEALIGAKDFSWTLLKPLTAMRVIGSETILSLYDNLRKGEDVWAVDVNEAKGFSEENRKKYNYSSWDFKAQHSFKDRTGREFSLSLEQIMSLYAYSKRAQADKHLEFGGFVFDSTITVTEKNKFGIPMKYRVSDATPYCLDKSAVDEVISKLTPDQKAFVDEMQRYLSDVMGEKGNEVSLAMYDIKLFNEKNYFPLKSSRWYMEYDSEQTTSPKSKNAGFTKKTVPQAGNPIVLSNFMDVWAKHVNEMSLYHALVLPLEDFTRVYNYKSTAGGYDSVKKYIGNAYGERASKYIETLLEQLNGGVRVQKTGTPAEKMISLAKKGAVLGSLSVAIQQPSAIMRAMAVINPQYFVTSLPKSSIYTVHHKNAWEELKKYAPIAIVKEMGRFDVGMGQATVDWIKGDKTIRDKVDDALSFLPGHMDEVAWATIWDAVKNEAKATTNLAVGSEDFYKWCGERFTQVISHTQVYDSVFSRSQLMRSSNPFAQMLTAFGAEPSTALNMAVDAFIQGKRTKSVKGFVKATGVAGGAIVSSIVLNSALKAIILAMRDDDEDETYLEKYLQAFVSDLKDNLNPLGLVPFAKDIVSIFKGYDVERMDMSLISDLKNAIDAFDSDTKSDYEKWSGLAGAVAAFFGVPVKNVERDIRAFFNTWKTLTNGVPTTSQGIENAIEEGWSGESKTNNQLLYEAIMSGDQVQIDRIKGRFKDEDAVEAAVRKSAKEAYVEGNLSRSEAEKMLANYGGRDANETYWDLNEWDHLKQNGTTDGYSKYNEFYEAVQTGRNLKTVISEYTSHGVEAKTLASQITSYFKPLYKKMSNSERASIKGYLLNAYVQLGYNRAEKSKDIDAWLKD